jgi:serine/threonine-protein kinase
VHDLALSLEDGKLYFTMKLVDGETLASVFAHLHQRPFSGAELERVLRAFLKVCDAVSFAHSRGVIHRDLKPENVMVGSHGQVYVMDWGVALLLTEPPAEASLSPVSIVPAPRLEPHGTVVGTNRYMAPEQALGLVHEQGPCSDVYGLGGILYALLVGRGPNPSEPRPLDGSLHEIAPAAEPSSRPAWPSLPPGLCRIAMKALSVLPRDRHASVDELKQDIENFLRGGGWFQTQSYAPGALLMTEGQDANTALIVTHGTCEVFRMVSGERELVRRIGPGEIVGETGLLTQSPRVASVQALEHVEVMVITKDALDRELDRSNWLRILVEALAARFRELDQAGTTSRG